MKGEAIFRLIKRYVQLALEDIDHFRSEDRHSLEPPTKAQGSWNERKTFEIV